MDKSAIKNFAVNTRRRLREQVEQKAFEIGITADEIKPVEIKSSDAIVIGGRVFNADIKRQRETLVNRIKQKGFDQVIDEVAYTWFNRFIALRFMEVNDYLDSGVRVFSNREDGKQEPEILSQAAMIDLPVNKDKIYEYLDRNENEELFKYLIITQCNVLNEPLPFMFEKIADYTELLFPDKLLNDDSIIREMVSSIAEEDWQEVEIIGWLYQYYISEKKDEVFAGLKKNIKISRENIPAATQLFTPAWIVKYMVENSLGKLWLEAHPDDELQAKWKYYLEPAEQEPEVQAKLDKLINKQLKPEEIKVLDPACGSGHILVYTFEVLYEIYKKAGYVEQDIPKLILENNLYGLDIDDRAAQLASFAVMMKAREKNRRIFREQIELNICAIQESNSLGDEAKKILLQDVDNENHARWQVDHLLSTFYDAKEYGSIIEVEDIDQEFWMERIVYLEKIKPDLFGHILVEEMKSLLAYFIKQTKIISQSYDVICTNPPYMGSAGMNKKLNNYIKRNFPISKNDLFAVFIERGFRFLKKNGYNAMVTMQVWMFLSSYELFRDKILKNKTIIDLIHIGFNSFPELNSKFALASAFTMNNCQINNYKSKFYNLNDARLTSDKEYVFLSKKESNNHYLNKSNTFFSIPGQPIAYSASKNVLSVFQNGKPLSDIASPRQGLATGDNNRFLRIWYEIDFNNIGMGFNDRESAQKSGYRWFPYNKGGDYRKWYGNNEYIVDWNNDGYEIRNFRDSKGNLRSRPQNMNYYFKKSITWSFVNLVFGVRYSDPGAIFDVGGSSIFPSEKEIYYLTGFLCTKIANEFLKIMNPSLNFQVGNIASLPLLFPTSNEVSDEINHLVKRNILISKNDWDSLETSWDFETHPILKHSYNADNIQQAFQKWQVFAEKQFYQLKANEEELNRIFIDIYGLWDELTPEVEEKEVTIRKADLERDIRSFISYAVGCTMGRYSLDEPGLIYAGGEFNPDRYNTFPADHDAIIPILDGDYFEDDIVARFIQFVKTTFGEKNLTDNLDFIAAALGKKDSETSVERICKYFLNDFYKDHLQVYKKRPIYWLFTSGKQKAFNALIYMHRYDKDTIARIRTDYLHELQGKYELEMRRLEEIASGAGSTKDKRDADKRLSELNKQKEELRRYDELLRHAADQQIEIDLDDGLVVNYAKFSGLLAKI